MKNLFEYSTPGHTEFGYSYPPQQGGFDLAEVSGWASVYDGIWEIRMRGSDRTYTLDAPSFKFFRTAMAAHGYAPRTVG